jgi:hypothetical protein
MVGQKSSNIRKLCLITGFSVGILAQFATIGASLVTRAVLGGDYLIRQEFPEIRFLWCLASSLLVALTIQCLKRLVLVILDHRRDTDSAFWDSPKSTVLTDILEHYVVLGAVAGISSTWITTDILMGIGFEGRIHAFIFLIVVYLWRRAPDRRDDNQTIVAILNGDKGDVETPEIP